MSIIDDVPIAVNDTTSVTEGGTVTGNVLTNDLHANGEPGSDIPVTVKTTGSFTGTYGTLTLNADGSYSYTAGPNTVPPGEYDQFDYTIVDADGDESTATLRINLNDSGLQASDTEALVNEAGLDLNGSAAAGNSEIYNGQITASGGSGVYTYALTSPATGTYGNLVLNADGSYTYTLTSPVDGPTANDGTNTIANADSFDYTVTDSTGNVTTGTINVSIIDDVPSITSIQSGVIDNVVGLSYTGHIEAIPGADGIAAYQFDTANISAPAGIIYQYSVNNTHLVATDGTGETVFTVDLHADGSYDFVVAKTLPESIVISPPKYDTYNIPNHVTSFTLNLYQSYNPNGSGIGDPVGTVTFDAYGGYLSVSNDGIGVQNNLMNVGEKLTMTFDTPASNATFAVGNFSDGDIIAWKVYDAAGTVIDSGTIDHGFYDTNGVWVPLPNNENLNYSIDLAQNGLDAGLQFTSMSIEAASNSYKFTGFSVEKAITVEDQHYDFSVVGIDGDGDISNSASFGVTVDGTGSILTGTAADEVFTGGSGADTFLTGGGDDHIADYSLSQGDKVDITSVLNSLEGDHTRLGFSTTSDGKAVLEIYDNAAHDHMVSSVTFDNITDATDLNSLLGKVDIDHTT